MEKVEEIVSRLVKNLFPNPKDLKLLIELLALYMSDKHFKVVSKSNETIRVLYDHFPRDIMEFSLFLIIPEALKGISD